MNYGYGFHWPAWSNKPYLESPSGHIIWLTVENKLLYLYTDDDDYAAPAEDVDSDVDSEIDGAERAVVRVKEEGRVAIPALNASEFHSTFGSDGIPTVDEINRRLTLDMHTRDVLGEVLFTKKIVRNHKNGTESMLAGKLKNGPRDIITYFFPKP